MTVPAPWPPVAVIDASAWISNLRSQDVNHAAALAWINNHLLNGGIFVAPLLLITETAAAISKATGQRAPADHAVTQLCTMPEMRLVPLNQVLVDEATDLAAGLGLRAADAYYVAVARQLGIPLVTFDHEQLTRPSGIIATIRP